MIDKTKVFVIKSFKCSLDDIGISQAFLKEGTICEIPTSAVLGLEKEGFIATGDDIPENKEQEQEGQGQQAEEGETTSTYDNMGREELVELLEAADEEVLEDETVDSLRERVAEIYGEEG